MSGPLAGVGTEPIEQVELLLFGGAVVGHALSFHGGGLNQRTLDKVTTEALETGQDPFLVYCRREQPERSHRPSYPPIIIPRSFHTNKFHVTVHEHSLNIIDHKICSRILQIVKMRNKDHCVWAVCFPWSPSWSRGRPRQLRLQQQQMRTCLLLCQTLQIRHLVVLVEIDAAAIGHTEVAQNYFQRQSAAARCLLTEVGFSPSCSAHIPVIPVYPRTGGNLVHRGLYSPWWEGVTVPTMADPPADVQVCTLVDYLDGVVHVPLPADMPVHRKPFVLSVDGVFKIKGVGTVVGGAVLQGMLSRGERVYFHVAGFSATANTLEVMRKEKDRVITGDLVGMLIADRSPVSAAKKIARGDVATCVFDRHHDTASLRSFNHMLRSTTVTPVAAVDASHSSPVNYIRPVNHVLLPDLWHLVWEYARDSLIRGLCVEFVAQVKVLQPQNGVLRVGSCPIIHLSSRIVRCEVTTIRGVAASSGADILELELGSCDQAVIAFRPQQHVVVQPFNLCKPLGLFLVLMDDETKKNPRLALVGRVLSVVTTDSAPAPS